MSIVSIKDLLNAGVHFGHQQRFWNPKMESFIFDTRKKISIIDLEMTQECLNAAASKAEEICSKGNRILFVGTKRSASKTIKESASSIGLPYIDKRWLGGTLTNWKTIRGSIRRLLDIEELQSSGRINKLSKKEAVDITKEYEKLDASVGGIKDMKGLPDAFVRKSSGPFVIMSVLVENTKESSIREWSVTVAESRLQFRGSGETVWDT